MTNQYVRIREESNYWDMLDEKHCGMCGKKMDWDIDHAEKRVGFSCPDCEDESYYLEYIVIGGQELIVDDEIVHDNNFESETPISKVAETTRVYFNLDTQSFGYGDDPRDWGNNGEKYVEVEEMDTHQDDPKNIPEGKLRIIY